MKTNLKMLLLAVVAGAGAILTAPSAVAQQVLHSHVPEAVARLNLRSTGRLDGTNRLNLAIALPLRNREALTNLLQQLYDPASSNYHHYLTPEQFAEKFGPAESDYQAVIAFAKANGLAVTGTHPNRTLLDVSGTVADIERTFHVAMRVYPHPEEARSFYAPDVEPSPNLAVPGVHISGLDNYSMPHPRLQVHSSVKQASPSSSQSNEGSGRNEISSQPNAGAGPGGTYMANDFRAAYVPGTSLTGAGQAVGLLQFDGYAASDIAYYIATNHLSSVTISNVLLDGFSGTPTGSGGEVEVCLDIEMTLSMAPGISTIYVYEAGPSGLWHDILNRMANDNLAKQLSCSWYIPGGAMDTVADGIFQQMAAQGQSFYSASGDYDAFCGLIPFPGDTPYVTEVGGTFLNTAGPGGTWTSETAWNRNDGIGSGGGISTQYAIPTWQQGLNMVANHGSTTMRNVPDVALTADYVYVRSDGIDQSVGGTSAAAPLWAGFTALVNQRAAANGCSPVGFVNPAIYAISQGASYGSGFHDITVGNNTNTTCGSAMFPAVAGYDLATGLGSPTVGLIDVLAGPSDPLQINPLTGFASSGGVGGPFTVTSQSLTLTNAGTNSLTWSLVNTSLWLNVSSTGGTLTPGGAATTVIVSLNSVASNLVVGAYSATVLFTNLNDNVGQSALYTLAVILPPTIVAQPTNQTVLDGNTATFTVGVTGGLPLSYQWQSNSVNLTDGGNVSGSATSTLVISNVAPAYAASYQVVVTNAAGVAVSSNALLITLAGNVDHFVWDTIAATQYYNMPFVVGLTAMDPANVVATNFGGNALVTGWSSVGQTTNRMFDGISPTNASSGTYTWGYPFTPTNNLIVTHVRNTFGSKVSLWTADGTLLATQAVTSASGIWSEFALAAPVQLTAGSNYVVAAYVSADYYDWATSIAGGFSDGIIGTSLFTASDGFPTDTAAGAWPLVGLRYVVGTLAQIPLTPTNAGPFVLGLWSGNVTAQQASSNAVLTADDGAGHTGASNPFSVIYSNQPPIIFSQPTDQSLPSGYTATFTLNADGSQPLSYFWSLNQTFIPGATNSSYTTNNVQVADSGSQFSCVVSNAYGSTNSRIATLTVLAVPPLITQQPANQNVLVGDTVSYSVAATGSLPLSYSWMRNETFIAGATNSSYTTNNVQLTDSGSLFSCVVSNAFGATNSQAATLTVVTPPTDWFTELFNSATITNVMAFKTFTFTPDGSANYYAVCGVTSLAFPTDPAGGTVLSEGDDTYVAITLTGGNTVSIYTNRSNVLYVGSNGYLTMNAGDTSYSPTYAQHFLYPRVSAVYRDLNASGLSTINAGISWKQLSDRVAVTYQGVPIYGSSTQTNSFQVEMFFDGVIRITYLTLNMPSGLVGLSAGTGQPTNFVASDYTTYLCSQPPVILTQPASQTNFIGGTATFTIAASGTSPLSYFWLRNGSYIVGATNAVYSTNNVQLSDSGSRFSCVVSNAYGSIISSNATLTVIPGPVFLTGNYLYLPIQTNGVFLAANTGAKYNSAGTGGASGVDFWEPGTPVYNWIVGVAGVNHVNGSSPVVGGFASLTISNLSSGALQRAVISGLVMPGLSYTRDISFATNSKIIYITDTLKNTGASALTNVVSLDTADPDQDAISYGISATLNDVVSVNTSNDMVVATGPSSGLSVGFGSDSGIQIPSAVGFNNLNAYSYTNVVDPNGASADIDINLAQNYGTLAAGQSRSVEWLAVFGNSKAEVTNAFVNLGLPPTVDHFNWNTIPSSKSIGVPFGVTITAQDVWGRNFTNFAGSVAVSALAGGRGVTNRMMEGLPPSSSRSGTYTCGYQFTPTNNLTVTHVSSYFGTKVSLWTGSGVLLATQLVASPSGVWSETALSTPVSLAAGSNYVVAAYVSANTYYWLTNVSRAFADGTIGTSVFSSADAFPTSPAAGAWLLVGLRYTVGAGQPLALGPAASGGFVNGAWTGNLTVLQAATNVVLVADDGSGHLGSSNPFQVVSNAAAYAMLTVNTNGSGTVNPNFNGAWLPVGQPYSLIATPGAGYVFFRWTGSLTTNNSMLNFVMTSNRAFTANFANQTSPPVGIDSGSSSQLVISWPAGAANFVMQTNGDLGTTNWGDYDPTMITTNGTAEQIIVNPTNRNLFFRLKQ